MRDFKRPRGGGKQFGVVLALSLVLTACVGTLLWLVWSEPDGLPASTSEEQSSRSERSSSRAVPSSAATSSSKNESSQNTVSSTATPPARPVQPTGVSTGVSAQKMQNLTINAALIHDENATYYNVFINAAGVTLKNKLVTGDLVLAESVGNGAVTLENVVVKGRILVNGAQTVTRRDVTAVQLIAQRGSGTTDYIISGTSTVHQMTAKNHLTIDEGDLSGNYAGVKKLSTERGTPMWQQVTLLKGTLEQVTINDATNLILSGGSSAEAVLANAPAHIRGDGLVYNLTVCSDEVSYERKPRNVTVEGRYSTPNEQSLSIGEVGREPGSGSATGTTTRKLAAPENLRIAAATEADSVTLAFDPVPNATGYTVSYSVTNGSNALNVTNRQLTLDTPRHAVSSALIGQAGTKISFKVRANSSASRYTASDYSGAYAKTVTVLGSPTNVRLALNGNKLSLSFVAAANAQGSSHEAVLSANGTEIVTQTLNPGVTAHDFTDLAAGAYAVTVRAIGDGRLTLTSGSATAAGNMPQQPTVRDLMITGVEGDPAVTFTGAAGVSAYTVTLSYGGSRLSEQTRRVEDDSYTCLFERPAAIAAGEEYTATVRPQNGVTSTETRAVQQRPQPGNPSITSSALGEMTFEFDRVSGVTAYAVVLATQTAGGVTTPLGATASHLTVTGLSTAEGDTFNFSVKTLGDGLFYADSPVASAAEVAVRKLSSPISPVISGDKSLLTLTFTTNVTDAHDIVVQTSDDGISWTNFSSQTIGAGASGTRQITVPTPTPTLPATSLQVRFVAAAKASDALHVDSSKAPSPALSVTRLDEATALSVYALDTDSGRYAEFSFEAVEGATHYTISYTPSVGPAGTKVVDTPAASGETVTERVALSDDTATVTAFTVTAHAPSGTSHTNIYLDSTASYRP